MEFHIEFLHSKEIVSPQKSGKITIPPFEVSTITNRDFFNRGVSKLLKVINPL